jgi:hypothetical protein
MSILDDVQLLVKKTAVTVIIYIIPIAILVGGLLLTRHLLDNNETTSTFVESTKHEIKP